ncbi:MAG: hypothetical protein BGN95_09515 [Sphingomonas sp. 66-10]|uniref:SAM-dependent methyltransferase n=1 Tax=Sphingomonas sp. 66-10 TaxID=1895848 RepID=UPI00092A8B20|nr:SAM-dependent methyltransferase [Sphingomonas sp. 66-10]OJU22421.1 MAG: hypothetical protein BGN95_09515 [Sphingomonas sp. 66-10]
MHYAYTILAGAAFLRPASHATVIWSGGARLAKEDHRWRVITRKLAALRARGRRSVRLVDANCGDGELLIAAGRHARALGFVAIEAHGVDGNAALIAHAQAAACFVDDPAIGFEFAVGDAEPVLRDEAAFPADIVLYAEQTPGADTMSAAARAAGHLALRALHPFPKRLAA